MIFKRGGFWWVGFRAGKQWIVRKSTGTKRKELAQKIEREIASKIAEGNWFKKDPAESTLFKQVWEKYLNEVAKFNSPGDYTRAIDAGKKIIPELGHLTLAEVTPAVLSAYKTKRLDAGLNPLTVVKELSYIRRVFSLCKKEWQLVKQNPFEFFTMPKANNQRISFLEPGQFEKLVQACPDWLKPIVILAKYTGIRRGNIINLKWSEVDLRNQVLNLDRTKNGERLTIPLSETPFKVLQSIVVHLKSPYVFNENGKPYADSRVGLAFRRARNRAGLPNFRFHDLRHDFASQLVKSGVDLYRVQKLLGHKDSRMTQRYAHLEVSDLRKAIEIQEESTQKSTQSL